MRNEILETIRGTLYLAKDQVSEDSLIERIAKDSMDVIELIAVLSNKYKVSINPSEMGNIKTIGDIIQYVVDHHDTTKTEKSLRNF